MFCVGLAGQGMICLAQKTSTENRSSEITWGGGWLPESEKRVDEYAAFRGVFTLNRSTKLRVEILGPHWFQSWIDEQFLTEGPARFPLGHAEYEVQSSKPIWMHAGGSSNAIRIEGKSVLPIQRQGNVWILKKEKE
jgi:hypothetical protein